MNATVFWRIVWKEYRAQRSFWLAMIVLTVVLETLLSAFPPAQDTPLSTRIELSHAQFGMAMLFAAFYALGAGAIPFAVEWDSETYEFLRGLPLRPVEAFTAKVTFAVLSTAALYVVVWGVAFAFAGKLPEAEYHHGIWKASLAASAEFMAWGVLFSLLLQRPLVAAMLAVTVPSLHVGLLNLGAINEVSVDVYRQAIPLRLGILAVVAVFDGLLGMRWLRAPMLPDLFGAGRQPSHAAQKSGMQRILAGALDTAVCEGRSRLSMLGTLVRHEFRQSRAISLSLVAMALPLFVFVWVDAFRIYHPEEYGMTWNAELAPLLVLPGILAAPLLGATLFLTDQTNCRFRFFAEHGIPPRLVWLSRQVRGMLLMVGAMLLLLPSLISDRRHHALFERESVFCFVPLAYASGQLCSMVVRSGILAAVSGVILTWVVLAWAITMNWFGLAAWWSFAPLPISFLTATWLHAPDWLTERTVWRARIWPTLVVAVPIMSVLVAIPFVRVFEIPAIDPGIDVAAMTGPFSAEEKQTLDLFLDASQEHWNFEASEQLLTRGTTHALPPGLAGGPPLDLTTEAGRRTLQQFGEKARAKAIDLAMKASRRPLIGLHYMPEHSTYSEVNATRLAQLLIKHGRELESHDQLDAALDSYLASLRVAAHVRRWSNWPGETSYIESDACQTLIEWSAHREQTPASVRGALQSLEQIWKSPASMCDYIRISYARSLFEMLGDEHHGEKSPLFSNRNLLRTLLWLPWERARAVRLLNADTAEALACYGGCEQTLSTGGVVSLMDVSRAWTSPTNDAFLRDILWRPYRFGYADHGLVASEARRRAARVMLALEAWKLEHGSLPKSLNDLQGKYFSSVPQGPFARGAFRYEPHGVPYFVTWISPEVASAERSKTLEKDQPLLALGDWSAEGIDSDFLMAPPASDKPDPRRGEVWKNVWVYPIP